MSTAFSIRQMESSDLDNLKQITNKSFPGFLRSIATQSRYSEGQVLVSEAQGTTVGFIKLAKFHLDGEFGCIFGVAVLKQLRRRGIATGLVKAGAKSLEYGGAIAVFAAAERWNLASLTVFEKAGFKRMGFLSLWRLFSWRIFEFYRDIRFDFGQIVLMNS